MQILPPAHTSPAAERNKGPILAALQQLLPPTGRLLEIAAGTGQHAAHCAAGLPGWQWQPTDPSPEALTSIQGTSLLRQLVIPGDSLEFHAEDLGPGRLSLSWVW